MPYLSATDRVRHRLLEWFTAHGHGSKRAAARALGRGPQWVSAVLARTQPVHLEDLDAIADLLNVPPGDLVRRPDDLYVEVLPSEFQFLTHLRTLPEPVRRHWLALLNHIAELHAQRATLAEASEKPGRRSYRSHKHPRRTA